MRMATPGFPGEIITEILEDHNVSLRQFAKAMRIAASTARRLLAGKTSVTPEMALRQAAVVGSTPETWLKIQTNFSLNEVLPGRTFNLLHS